MADSEVAALISAANKFDRDRAELAEKLEKKADELSRKIMQINNPAMRAKSAENHRVNAELGKWILSQQNLRNWLANGSAAMFIESLDERSKSAATRMFKELNINTEKS